MEPFGLIETLRFSPGEGLFLLEHHLTRLARSAAYFGIPVDRGRVAEELRRCAAGLQEPSRVRVVVDPDGAPRVESCPLPEPGAGPLRVGLAADPVDPESVWLYHKTTRRALYDGALASRPDCDEVLLWNARGEVTEATSSNVVINVDGTLVTPPVGCGLLPGTFRAHLLETGRVVERVVRVDELFRPRRFQLVNSVRGSRAGRMIDSAPPRGSRS
jgi:para-aminobenzoate synthetase / 4-amino-4-deoxychorismate lyase